MPKLACLHICSRTRSLCHAPRSVPSRLWKGSRTIAFSSWKHVLPSSIQRIPLSVGRRTWTLLCHRESFRFGADCAQGRVIVLSNWESSIFGVEIDISMLTWTWSLLIGEVFIDHVNRFGSGGETKIISFEFFIIILNRLRGTCPGPGCLWSCGTK